MGNAQSGAPGGGSSSNSRLPTRLAPKVARRRPNAASVGDFPAVEPERQAVLTLYMLVLLLLVDGQERRLGRPRAPAGPSPTPSVRFELQLLAI